MDLFHYRYNRLKSHGDQHTTLTVPSEVAPPCVGPSLFRISGVDANPGVDANAAGDEDQPAAWQ